MHDSLRILGQYIRRNYRFLPKDRQSLERWQEKQIVDHISFVRAHSKFYRDWWQGYQDSQWRHFPVIDKAVMMAHFDQLNTVEITKEAALSVALQAEESRDFSPAIGSVTVGLSSGTSGHRGIFLVSQKERTRWAGAILARALPRPIWHKQRIAFFLRANSNLYQSVGSRHLQFQFYDLLSPFSVHREALQKQQPTILVAPPSMLRMIADSVRLGELVIQPSKIISVAEVLDPLDEQIIEQQFNQPVHQIYQCTEGFLAHTCTEGTLHLNEDIVKIEKQYLDRKSGKFMPIITDFSRKAQPIIRYRLNDILTEQQTICRCGSPFTAIASIEGRTDDIFYFYHTEQARLEPFFPDFIRRAILQVTAPILEYKVIQHQPDRVEVALCLENKPTEETKLLIYQQIEQRLQDLCRQTACRCPVLAFTDWQDHRSPATKLKRVERKFAIE
ncbi:F390 synthetase-related protein [Gracilibacillus alcaliphilus]|uniref:F390 synthetase-related protein n=1 Tax=Gracilibacillus alcaliphilus TaxID=1401441 RepID=UPI00195D86C9|nr:F390 synthetase-related protein [Gracilibacillus alcaliphilus]MBM7677413.1 putative adenylate-forming enzyme [Gracilibacillus alcaliphilus]